jgi:hypothetical protein
VPVEKEFRLRQLRAPRPAEAKRERARVPRARAESSAKAALAALKATTGAGEILEKIPQLGVLDAWDQIAFFSVCAKSGSATLLDIWDADHFVNACLAWFSCDGYTAWGSSQTKTGRVNCYFRAPAAGTYVCNARLQSFPSTSLAIVECLIDNASFGTLPFTGTIDQPHPSTLGRVPPLPGSPDVRLVLLPQPDRVPRLKGSARHAAWVIMYGH